jgi:hypothetical protein
MIIRQDFENLYSNKMENAEKIDKFLDLYDVQKLNQEDTNKHISNKNWRWEEEIGSIILWGQPK